MSGYDDLTEEHRAFLNAHAIDDDVIDAAGLWSALKRDDLPGGIDRMVTLAPVPGIVIPYRDADGKVTSYRYRPDNPAPDPKRDGKPAKYVGQPGVNVPNFARVNESDRVLTVEGEKQTLAACSYAPADLDVIGIPGCSVWHGMDLSFMEGKTVYVAFDADRRTNPDVAREAAGFAGALAKAGAVSVRFVNPPGEGKDGLDDVLARLEEDERTDALVSWIEAAEELNALGLTYDGLHRTAVLAEAQRQYVTRKARELVDDQIARETGHAIDWAARAINGADWLDADEPEPRACFEVRYLAACRARTSSEVSGRGFIDQEEP
ncbi:hypothetical protein, partial [Microbispora bryophytorum]|uniref:hypothetical protein n=1 Tax=Microbispora bryophytorum TaxID=1460882 RepID=UPI00340D1FCB